MANTPIFTRSPRFIELTGSNFDTTRIELFIHNDPDPVPSTPTEDLSKPIPTLGTSTVSYDISPFIREFISHTSFVEITTGIAAANVNEYALCTVKTYINDVLQDTLTFIAFDGYGYFEDGGNPTPSPSMLTEGTYIINEVGGTGAFYQFNDQSGPVWFATYTGLKTGFVVAQNLFEEVSKVPYVPAILVDQGAKLVITKDSVVQKTYIFQPECESKYEVFKCDFVNRSGMWERLTFFKTNRVNITRKSDKHDSFPETTNYDTSKDIRQSFNTNGQESIKLNTGFLPESNSEIIKELSLSEKITLNGRPVELESNGFELFTHINNSNINYEVRFRYTHKLLNYII